MFRKIITLALLVSVFSIASSASVYAQAKMSDENLPLSVSNEIKNEKIREIFLKKDNQPDLEKKETMADYRKQKAQAGNFSTSTKILIGVGIAAAVVGVVVFAASRSKIEPFKNGVL